MDVASHRFECQRLEALSGVLSHAGFFLRGFSRDFLASRTEQTKYGLYDGIFIRLARGTILYIVIFETSVLLFSRTRYFAGCVCSHAIRLLATGLIPRTVREIIFLN